MTDLKSVKIGDVFEIVTKRGMAYFQCVKEAKSTECEVIRILPGVFSTDQTKNLDKLVKQRELFFIQFPLKYAVKKNCVKLIGNYPVPDEVTLPKCYRDKHIVRGEFINWHIVDAETLNIRAVKELSEEEKRLSPAGIWNDTLLAERIAEGWKPEDWV